MPDPDRIDRLVALLNVARHAINEMDHSLDAEFSSGLSYADLVACIDEELADA